MMSDIYGTKMITHRWCLYCGAYQNPRAQLGANDLRILSAKKFHTI